MASCETSCSYVASTTFEGVKTLCEGAVYLFHEPVEQKPEVEIVFIHGLQLGENSKKAYLTTWLARDGTSDNCWPTTWLVGKFPNARILSLSYDASALKSATSGRMDLHSVGETLVGQMVFDGVRIGQNGCPVVFVCHSLGGLIAKQIIVSGHRLSFKDGRIGQLLRNVKAFFFYATPHGGSILANLAKFVPFLGTGPLVDDLEIMNTNTGRLNDDFQSIQKEISEKNWKIYVVREQHAFEYGVFNMMVVKEPSARCDGWKCMSVAANHFDVCKPKSEVDTSFQYLVECIREVVKEDTRSLLELPGFVVEMEKPMKKLQSKLDAYPIIGLVGMGGIGKTTLSKHFYNQEQRQYEKCCYLEDVKSKGDIRCSQEQLYLDLCGVKWDESKKVEVRMKEIRDIIMKQKVLVVVDDVGNLKSLEALQVEAFNDSRNGSKMIVTCRNKNNLPFYVSEDGIMEVDGIAGEQSMELFSYYAFDGLEVEAKTQLRDEATKIVEACGGLPLSLEVIGQYLRKLNWRYPKGIERRKKDWEDALKKLHAAEALEGTVDDERLWKKLRISYDALAQPEKRLFLDFACILWRIPSEDTIVRIYDSSLELQNLKDCSLIKLGDDKTSLIMHEQLRDMGKKIVEEEANGDHWFNMRRLWSWEKIERIEMDGGRKKWENLEGILRNPDVKFPEMRLLDLEGSKSDVVKFFIPKCSQNLRWLCLNKIIIIEQNIQMLGSLKGLRVLHMVGCKEMEMLPSSIGNLFELMELDLSQCVSLKHLPDTLGKLKQLQKLILSHCKNLEALPDSIGDLCHLTELDLKGCGSLERLPGTLGKLKLLQKLILSSCGNLKLWELCLNKINIIEQNIQMFGLLKGLRVLHMVGCKQMKMLPSSIGNLFELMELDLSQCESLKRFPDTLGKLKQLQKLILSHCKNLEALPNSIGDLCHLTELDLEGCGSLERLPDTLGKLKQIQKLILSKCGNLKALPDSIGDLCDLTELDLKGCGSLERLPDTLGKLKQLQKLILSSCGNLKALPDSIGDLCDLTELDLKWCGSLERLPDTLGKLKQLPILALSWCGNLKALPDSIGDLCDLRSLGLLGCGSLERLPDTLGKLKQLRELMLLQCLTLKALPDSIGDLSHLTNLALSGCETLKALPDSLGDLCHLTALHLEWCGSLKRLPDTLGKLKQLQRLILLECRKLEALPDSIGDLCHLTELDLRGCRSLERWPNTLGKLKQLQILSGC